VADMSTCNLLPPKIGIHGSPAAPPDHRHCQHRVWCRQGIITGGLVLLLAARLRELFSGVDRMPNTGSLLLAKTASSLGAHWEVFGVQRKLA